jgi:hypothetical protein
MLERIVLLLKDSPGVRWELARVIRENAAVRTLFLLDPAIKDDAAWEALATTVLPLLRSAALATADFGFQSKPIGFYFDGGKLVQIVNANRTATSYRTAFLVLPRGAGGPGVRDRALACAASRSTTATSRPCTSRSRAPGPEAPRTAEDRCCAAQRDAARRSSRLRS